MNPRSIKRLVNKLIEKSRSTDSITVCIGAGSSIAAGMPTWRNMIQDIFSKSEKDINIGAKSLQNFLQTANFERAVELVADKVGFKTLVQYFEKTNSSLQPTELHNALISLPARAFITTNFDTLVERTLLSVGKVPQVILSDDDLTKLSDDKVTVVKLNGSIDHPDSLILSSSHMSYRHMVEHEGLLHNYLNVTFSTSLVLFVGYSISEEFAWLYERYRGVSEKTSNWLVLTPPFTSSLSRKLWENRGIDFIELELDFHSKFIRLLTEALLSSKKPTISSRKPRQIFISVSNNDQAISHRLRRLIRDIGYEPISVSDEPMMGISLFERFEKSVKESSAAIVYLAHEEHSRYARSKKHRANTILELGFLMGTLGMKNVFLVLEGQADVPSDLAGVQFVVSGSGSLKGVSSAIKNWLPKHGGN